MAKSTKKLGGQPVFTFPKGKVNVVVGPKQGATTKPDNSGPKMFVSPKKAK